jgi:hypothetical protein
MTQDIQESNGTNTNGIQKLESWFDIPSTAPQHGSDLIVIDYLSGAC